MIPFVLPLGLCPPIPRRCRSYFLSFSRLSFSFLEAFPNLPFFFFFLRYGLLLARPSVRGFFFLCSCTLLKLLPLTHQLFSYVIEPSFPFFAINFFTNSPDPPTRCPNFPDFYGLLFLPAVSTELLFCLRPRPAGGFFMVFNTGFSFPRQEFESLCLLPLPLSSHLPNSSFPRPYWLTAAGDFRKRTFRVPSTPEIISVVFPFFQLFFFFPSRQLNVFRRVPLFQTLVLMLREGSFPFSSSLFMLLSSCAAIII